MLSDLPVFRAHRLRLHCRRPWRRVAVAAGLLGLLSTPLAAEPCDSLERRNNRQSVNLGSGWTLPIVANPGHLDASVAFTALGATDTAYRFHDSGAVEMLFNEGPSLTLQTLMGDEPTLATDVRAEAGQASTQRWITPFNDLELPTFGVVTAQLEPSITARHHVSSRLLRTTYDGPWRELGLQLEGNVEAGPQDADGSLTLYVEGHSVRLYPASSGDGDDAVLVPFELHDGSVLRLEAEAAAEVDDGLPLQVVWEVEPYFHRYDAIVGADGGSLAVTTTVGALDAGGRDVMILGLDADGAPSFSTVLASSGDDRAAALTASSSEELYVAGWQGAPGIAVDGQDRRASGPFLARLSRDGKLVTGRYLSQDGVDAVHDLAVDAEDRLLVSARAGRTPLKGVEALPVEVTVPTDQDLGSQGDLVVLELDAELRPSRQSRIDTVVTDIRLEVRPGCDGKIVVGPRPVTAAQASCTGSLVTDTYQADNPTPADFFDGFVDAGSPADPWGWHALRWKHETQTGHAYTPPNVAPFLVVGNTDHTTLDNLEATGSVFATEPNGSWLHNTSLSAEELAIGAALYMDFWKSPSYANLKLAGEAIPRPAGLMEVEFCVEAIGSNNSVVDYCAASAASVGIFSPRYPIDGIDALCNIQYGFGMINIRHVDIDHWVNGSTYTQATRLIQPTFRSAFDGAGTLKDRYIADPPDGAAAEGWIREASRRMSGEAVRAVPTVTYRVTADGSVEPIAEGEGWVAALPEIASIP